MRLTLEIPPETHRQIKTMAAYNGMTIKDFLLSRALGADSNQASKAKSAKRRGKPKEMDQVEYFNPVMQARFDAALKSKERISFANEEELRRAIGL